MAQIYFDLYGFESDDMEALVEPLERVLQIKFVARTSDYWGDYYNYKGQNKAEYRLQRNVDEENEIVEKSHPEMKLLFRVTETERADEVKRLLTTNITETNFLRRKVFDESNI